MTVSHITESKIPLLMNILQQFLDVETMERPKLRFFDKVPQYPANLKPPKMQKVIHAGYFDDN